MDITSTFKGRLAPELLFGTGGAPHSSRTPATISGIERIAELRLGCMEIEFVQGVKMAPITARQVAEIATLRGVKLSVHAPYFINFNAREPEKIKASQQRLLQSVRIASLCGARSVAFHTAFYMGDSPELVYERIKNTLEEVLNQLKGENINVLVRPELMGKVTQFGNLDEILRLCTELDGVAPCIDFAHWHARTGKFNSYPEFAFTLQKVKEKLGKPALEDMHIHFSGIEYTQRGEVKHLDLKDSDFQYAELLKAFRDYEVKGLVICESPNLEKDALLLKETYDNLVRKG